MAMATTLQPTNAIRSQIKLNQLRCSQLTSKLIFVLPPHRFGLNSTILPRKTAKGQEVELWQLVFVCYYSIRQADN